MVVTILGYIKRLAMLTSAGRRLRPSDFPPEFDPVCYKATYEDLRHFDSDGLLQHWQLHGIREGRRANQLSNRNDFVGLIPQKSRVLEIGPFNAPLKKGANVKYFDVLDKQGLIARAQSIGFETSNIPHVDFVSAEGNLATVHEKFDFVLSSHVFEHQPNLIKHLTDIHNLLEDEGYYCLLVPDKRYCFDHFIPETNLAQIVEANINNNVRHSLRSVIECRALTTHNECLRHWQGDHGDPNASLRERCEAAVSEYKNSQGRYIDVHAWYFTPESFRNIVASLNQIGAVSFETVRIYTTQYGFNEFWAILQKKGAAV